MHPRGAVSLSVYGHKMTGVDLSTNSIPYAKGSAKQKGLDSDYVCKDMFQLVYTPCFDVVLQIYGEVNSFSNED